VLQPTFFHNGSFTGLEDAIRHHLNVYASAGNYDPAFCRCQTGPAPHGPIEPVLMTLAPELKDSISLERDELEDLVAFVRDALQHERVAKKNLWLLFPIPFPVDDRS
jgi:cytochrome c peroxidase